MATGIPDMEAPSLGAAADAGAHPALPGAPSFLDEVLAASGIPDMQAPCAEVTADAGVHQEPPAS